MVCFQKKSFCSRPKVFFDKTTETLRPKKAVLTNNQANTSLLINVVYHVKIHTIMCIVYFGLILTSFDQNDNRCIVRRFQSPLIYLLPIDNNH